MLSLKQIESYYSHFLKPFKKNILREYLQYKILEATFDTSFGNRLSFMGGTAIHILHGNQRFSEDLDFDNQGLQPDDFEDLAALIKKQLQLQGYTIESRVITKKSFRAYLKFPDILYNNNITRHKQEKLSIQIDMEPQNFLYSNDQPILNKFDVFQRINSVPLDLLLSQKILCLFNRPRLLGRDFYDIIFLFGKAQPHFPYLEEKLGIKDLDTLKVRLIEKCAHADFDRLARDVRPFLFQPDDAKKISLFPDYIKGIEF